MIPSTWVQFSAYVGADKMQLPVDGVKDLNGNTLYIGPVMSQDAIYPTFLSPLADESDVLMMEMKGNLYFEHSNDRFVIKDENDSLGNVFFMNNTGCVMKGNGQFNLVLNFSSNI